MNGKPRWRRPARARGAALLLLVVVMGVGAAALLISALSHSSLEARRDQRTLLALAQARDALVGYAIMYGRLPLPARSATDGREREQPCASEANCSGFLPWATLGVSGTDAWGKLLRYSVTPEFSRQPLTLATAVATKTVQSRDGQGRLFYVAGFPRCTLRERCSPAVVYSHGKNNFGTTELGLAQANAARDNLDEQQNDATAVNFISRAASDDPASVGGVYDDLVSAISLPLLYNRMNFAGQLH